MRIAIPTAPGADPSPNAYQRTSGPLSGSSANGPVTTPPLQNRLRPFGEAWAPYGLGTSLVAWVLDHRALVLGLALALLIGTAAVFSGGLGSAQPAPALRLVGPGFGIGALTAPVTRSAPRVRERETRQAEASHTPLSLIPSAFPSMPTTSAERMIIGLDLPAGVTATAPGNGAEGQQSSRSLLLAFALAVFLVYLVTASQLRSLLNPLSILFTVPMGLIAAAWGLYATGATLNSVALIGTILLAGMLVNNAIILIDAIKHARARGRRTRDAMIQASASRVRPIMIASIATVLGLLPMAIGVGEGIEMRRPMTITVIAGLAVATFLVSVAAPVLYTLFDPREKKTI